MNAVLGGELGEDKQQRYLAALNGTRMLHHELVESVLSSKLNGLVVKLTRQEFSFVFWSC